MSEDQVNPVNGGKSRMKAASEGEHKKMRPLWLPFTLLFRPVAKRWLQALAWLVNFIVPTIVAILFGFSPLPQSIPLVDAIKGHPFEALGLGGGLALLTSLSLCLLHRPEPKGATREQDAPGAESHDEGVREPELKKDILEPNQRTRGSTRPWMIVTGLSIASSLVCLILLLVVLIRPAWCPSSLCPMPQLIVNPHGVHDDNLEVYFQTFESPSTVLTGDIAQYSQGDIPVGSDPKTIGAVRMDGKVSPFPYRVVVGVHSLQQGRFGLIIEQVTLVVRQILLLPRPLDVLAQGITVDYRANPYVVTYNGQQVGAKLSAMYLPAAFASVALNPGEADQLDIQVNSHVVADLQFQLQVTYRVANESHMHVLTLPFIFGVAFSDASNWHAYRLESGHLVASS